MTEVIEKKFNEIGARVRVATMPAWGPRGRSWNGKPRLGGVSEPVRVDVQHDSRGEFFDVRHDRETTVRVLDVRRDDRHLLSMASRPAQQSAGDDVSTFLCGRDERSWFVAAIPEDAHATSVQAAKDALKPEAVWDAIREYGVRPQDRDKRRTEAFVRQGEWFFIPRPKLLVHASRVLEGEPIRRGASKPHVCQYLYRTGGEMVHVSGKYPNGLTDAQFFSLEKRERKSQRWTRMAREAHVFVRGSVRHPDHKTIVLAPWHEVVMNTETRAKAMEHMAFLD
jgi:hypothetical protein